VSETSGFPQYAGATSQMRTLAVRITDDLRAQLDVIAQLNDRSVTEEIRLALEDWIERSKSDPQVLKRAETVRADIEREAQTKCNAIEAFVPHVLTARPRHIAPRRCGRRSDRRQRWGEGK
jgi:predicted transcriptional regulator